MEAILIEQTFDRLELDEIRGALVSREITLREGINKFPDRQALRNSLSITSRILDEIIRLRESTSE